jgi:hypothetical protein
MNIERPAAIYQDHKERERFLKVLKCREMESLRSEAEILPRRAVFAAPLGLACLYLEGATSVALGGRVMLGPFS